MKKVLLFSLLSFFLLTSQSYSQVPDSCLKIFCFPQDSTFFNLDSVKVDSCFGSPTYGEFYATHFFYIKFKYNVLPRPGIYPKDTIIEYTWQDIDTSYSYTREGFQQLEQEFGSFWLREERLSFPDTTQFLPRTLLLRFEDYINIDSVENFVKNIQLVSEAYYRRGYGITSRVNDGDKVSQMALSPPIPNPTTSETNISFELLESSKIQIRISDVLGNIISIINKYYSQGRHTEIFNFEGLSSGVYLISLSAFGEVVTEKVEVVK
jgi:hypothetical protein